MAARSPPQSALQEQTAARKSCAKNESTEEIGQLVRSQTISYFRTEFSSGEHTLTACSCAALIRRVFQADRVLVKECLLTRMTRLVRLWFGRSFSWRFL